ncbi:MAG TPA: hypothetical protein VMW67_00340 [Desulfobacteria bacterium]|nr:hypothetical protein [Desulfobacteria bacterium]
MKKKGVKVSGLIVVLVLLGGAISGIVSAVNQSVMPSGEDGASAQTATLHFSYGWNAISAPVTDSRSMGGIFITQVPGFYAVYSWNSDFQCWTIEDLSDALDPAKGYVIWSTGDAEVELTGEPATYSPNLKSWSLIGVGAYPVNLSAD